MNHFACLPSFRHSTPSPDGQFIATVHKSCLLIRSCIDYEIIQCFESDKNFTGAWRFAKWYNREQNSSNKLCESRVNEQLSGNIWQFLLADDDFVHVYDANGAQRHVKISNLAGFSGRIADIQFGFTEDQILVFSDFGLKVILLTISTQKGLELRAPKQVPVCYSYRPRTGHLALLTRPSLHDVLLYLQPDGSGPVVPVELATIDVQGVLWSPNGQWLALWDAASAGYKVLIYTADGHLFKTYYGGQDADTIGLGVKTLKWSASGEFLAIGDFDHRAILLKSNTFVPVISFHHSTTLCLPQVPVWEEQINASGHRSYAPVSQPACPPTGYPNTDGSLGVSTLEFNIDGTLLATKSDVMPSTVWIWSPHRAAPAAVLIHHSPVKRIQWHPTIADALMIHCNIPEAAVHIWKATWKIPKVVGFHLKKPGGRMEAAWLGNNAANWPTLMLGNAQNYAIAQIDHTGELISASKNGETLDLGPEDMYDENNLVDDPSPTAPNDDETQSDARLGLLDGENSRQDEVDDTFDYRRHLKTAI